MPQPRRLNPRQRWSGCPANNPANKCIGIPKGASTVAGVPAVVWGAFLAKASAWAAAHPYDAKASSCPGPDRVYHREQQNIRNDLHLGLKMLDTANGQWVTSGMLRLRTGRGHGTPDVEVTVVCKSADVMRSFLTQASLGLTDPHRQNGYSNTSMSKWENLLYTILQMLDQSCDRRPYNRYTYQNIPYTQCGKLGVQRRREYIEHRKETRVQVAEIIKRRK